MPQRLREAHHGELLGRRPTASQPAAIIFGPGHAEALHVRERWARSAPISAAPERVAGGLPGNDADAERRSVADAAACGRRRPSRFIARCCGSSWR